MHGCDGTQKFPASGCQQGNGSPGKVRAVAPWLMRGIDGCPDHRGEGAEVTPVLSFGLIKQKLDLLEAQKR